MNRRPPDSPHVKPLADRLSTCVWWLPFVAGATTGAAAGLVLALWLVLPLLPRLLPIVVGWLGGKAAGWTLAALAGAALARRIEKGRKRIDTAHPALAAPPLRGVPRAHGTARIPTPGLACP